VAHLEVVSFEMAPLEVVSFEMVPLEVVSFEMVPLEATPDLSTSVTTPEMLTANACRLAGCAHGQHHRQCAEHHERDFLWTRKLLHDDASFSPPANLGWLLRQEDSPETRLCG